MFDNLICLMDAISVLDGPRASLGRPERLASVSSIDSLCSIGTMEPIQYHPALEGTKEKVPRKRISLEQTETLQALFDTGVHFPSRETRERLSRQLGLTTRTIQVWFQNRRQAARNKARSVAKPSVGKKLAIRWMKPVVFPGNPAVHQPSSAAASSPIIKFHPQEHDLLEPCDTSPHVARSSRNELKPGSQPGNS